MWRHTHDPKYREWGWAMFQAFETWSRVPTGGYAGIKNVDEIPPKQTNLQESFWLAETLKYFYLLFCDDDVLPLDQYVFTTEAHPLKMMSPNSF